MGTVRAFLLRYSAVFLLFFFFFFFLSFSPPLPPFDPNHGTAPTTNTETPPSHSNPTFHDSAIISIVWLLHIIVYMVIDPPPTIFLNSYFEMFDSTIFSFFGTISVAIFSFYMLIVAIKGNFKLGLRFFIIPIHPMKYGDTLMNTFLFNVILVLFYSIPCVQFCTQAFQDYARLTDVDLIFGTQVRYLRGFRMFFANNIFIYILLGWSLLCLLYLIIYPGNTKPKPKEIRKALEKYGVSAS